MRDWIETADATAPLDLVVANAGISGGTGGLRPGEPESQAAATFDPNLGGWLNTVHPAIDVMRPRRHGQIAVISSLASFRGMPGAPADSASKAAARTYGEALRGVLRPHGIAVSIVCPGFVRSRMTATNRYSMPFLMDAEKAARIIRRGMADDKGRIALPWPTSAVSWLFGSLPHAPMDPRLARLEWKTAVEGM